MNANGAKQDSEKTPGVKKVLTTKFVEFVIGAILLGGLLYSSTAAWKANQKIESLDNKLKEQKESMQVLKRSLVDILAEMNKLDGIKELLANNTDPSGKDIIATALDAGSFNTLAAAMNTAGLSNMLVDEGPFTVFMPTDEAFAKLPAGTVESLLRPENKDKLASILEYHIVPGRIMSEDILAVRSAQTVEGTPIQFTVRDGNVSIDEANLIKADIDAANGVIHVIDAVIFPGDSDNH